MSATRGHTVFGLLMLLGVAVALSVWPVQGGTPPRSGIVLVMGDRLGPGGEPNQSKAERCFRALQRALVALALPHDTTSDSRVENDGLAGGAVAIFPYSRAMSEREAAQVSRFVEAGGRLLVFSTAHPRVLSHLGVRHLGYLGAADRPAPWALTVSPQITGAPPHLSWPAGLVSKVTPHADASVLAEWNGAGRDPALVGTSSGVFVAASAEGLTSQSQNDLLLALLGHLDPTTWDRALGLRPEAIGPLGRFRSLVDLWQYLQAAAAETVQPSIEAARLAMWTLGEARGELRRGGITRARELAAQASDHARTAFWASYPPVPGEMRGVWMHSAAEPSWEVAMAHLSRAHFNAVFPYMMSGGVAFYRSRCLPRHACLTNEPDRLAAAVDAGRKYGIPVHARMLNLSLLFSSEETRRRWKSQGRLALNSQGESVNWLCPTDLRNRQDQVAAALEMAAYGVDGIQFDYLRYGAADTCCCSGCRAKFETESGVRVPRWPNDVLQGSYRGRFADWRREQVTNIVRDVSRAVRRDHPKVALSAAVFLNWEDHRETFGQDWKVWIDEGLVDFICPMNYTTSDQRFNLYLSRQKRWIGDKVPLITGIGVYADGHRFPGPELAVEQVRQARESGARGFIIFNYSPALVRDYLPYFALGITRAPTHFVLKPASLEVLP